MFLDKNMDTWMVIPVSKWLIAMLKKSQWQNPLRVVADHDMGVS